MPDVIELTGDTIPLEEKAIGKDGRTLIKVAKAGWGTSGYYSKPLLERDSPKAWPKGTHMYWDHPTATQERERPERSLRDLAGVLEEDASWRENGPRGPGVYAAVRALGTYKDSIEELAPHIGVSLRAAGRAESGEAEGRRGVIVQEIAKGKSIDFVTQAGLGGEIIQLFEAARQVHGDDTGNVSDNGDRTNLGESGSGALNEEAKVAELEEAKRQLTEAQASLAEANKKLDEANKENARLNGDVMLREARDAVVGELVKADLPDVTRRRIAKFLTRGTPPVKDGKLDTESITRNVSEAVREEQEYLQEVTGTTGVHGFGGSSTIKVDEAKQDAELEKSFKAFGMSESAAKVAAQGRN